MSDYQAIYDAVSRRLSGASEAIRDAVTRAFDISHQVHHVADSFMIAANEQMRPSVLFRPTLDHFHRYGQSDQWRATYGHVRGIGDTPDAAMRDFDQKWSK